jgi:hypothetical protein
MSDNRRIWKAAKELGGVFSMQVYNEEEECQ